MKLVVIGATGATGRRVVTQALERGDEVTAYVRSLYKTEDLVGTEGLRVIPGVAEDAERMTTAMEGADAVVVALGPAQTPATFLRCDLMQHALPAIRTAMVRAGVRRLVVLSAWGVGETARAASLPLRIGFATLMRAVYTDHEAAEAPLRAADDVDLTTVHPVMLTDDAEEAPVEVVPFGELEPITRPETVSRDAVAAALLDAAHDPATIGQQLVVHPAR